MKRKKDRGFGIIEIVIGVAVLAGVLISMYTFFNKIVQVERRTNNIIRANYLLLEGVDVVKILRDNGWAANVASLTRDAPYYFHYDSGDWSATSTANIIDGQYTRYFTVADVYRDGNDDIATSRTLDPGTLEVDMTVEWAEAGGATTSTVFNTYVTDLFSN